MAHRSDYRIVKVHKKGYYTYYQVQRNFLLFFWNSEGNFDDVDRAQIYINDQLVEETREVLK